MHSGKDIKRDRNLQVRVDARCAERFAALAAALNVSQGDLLRRAVEDLLAKAEQMAPTIVEIRERGRQSVVEGIETLATHPGSDRPSK